MGPDPRFAACDVGSNAIRLVVARVIGKTERFFQREASYRVPLRLGEDAFSTGMISDEKIAGLMQVFLAYRSLIDFFMPHKLRACATAALREARNGQSVAEYLWQKSGIRIDIITGAEEASTLFANHIEAGLSTQKDYLYVDVGGGSTELTLLCAGKARQSESFRIGGVRLIASTVDPSEWSRMKNWLESLPHGLRLTEAIGTGGNISKIYDLAMGTPGNQLARHKLQEVVEALEPMSIEERIRSYGLKPDRADVIVPAGKIYYQVLKWADINAMIVPKLGLADGILSQLFEQVYGYPPRTTVGRSLVDES